MIEIQYAIFAQYIHTTHTPVNIQGPLCKITLPYEKRFTMDFPLYVTFIHGSKGKHMLDIEVIRPNGHKKMLANFKFDWTNTTDTYGKAFSVRLEDNLLGIYRFRLTIDGQDTKEVPLSIVQKRSFDSEQFMRF